MVTLPESSEDEAFTLAHGIPIYKKSDSESEESLPENGGKNEGEFSRTYRPPIITNGPEEETLATLPAEAEADDGVLREKPFVLPLYSRGSTISAYQKLESGTFTGQQLDTIL